MTYESASSNTPYEGNGSATSFPTGFTFLANDQVKAVVRIDGLDIDLVEDTDYTLTGAGEAPGGTLTFPIEGSAHHTLASGERLVIYLDPPIVQDRAIGQSSVVDLPEIEAAVDQLTMICASLDDKISRVPQYPPSSTAEEIGSPEEYLAEIASQRAAAEAAQAGAETAQGLAEAAQAGAETAQGLAEDARDAAEAARDAFPAAADIVTVNAPFFSRRSRLCNGLFRVDNLNAGAAVTPSSGTNEYVVDNLSISYSQVSKLTAQRVASSIAALAFAEKFTVAAAVASPGAADYFNAAMGIEGLDFADLRWGTANAKSITIQARVRVSVAGTYGFAFRNGAVNRSYVFTKDLAAGDNYITQTIPGDTSGTWPTGAECAAYLTMDLGCGSNRETATPNAWVAGNYCRTAACARLISTAGATYEIGGIQVEEGEFATPLEVLPMAQAEAWCQRYHPTIRSEGVSSYLPGNTGIAYSTTQVYANVGFMATPRVDNLGVVVSDATHFSLNDGVTATACTLVAITVNQGSRTNKRLRFTVAAGLTQWRPYHAYFNSAAAWMKFTGAEL